MAVSKNTDFLSGLLKSKMVVVFIFLALVPYLLWVFSNYVVNLRRKNDAFSYYYAKNFSKAYEEVMPFAVGGDNEARFMIGAMTAFGVGTKKDKMLATQWFSCEASKGCVRGYNEFRAGQGCFSGEWGTFTYEECILWLKFSSDLGYQPASALLEEYQKKQSSGSK